MVIRLILIMIKVFPYQLPTKFYSIFPLAGLTPYANKVIGDHQCGFRRNRSTTDQIFFIRQILEEKWEYNGAVHQLFIDFKKAYDSIREKFFTVFCLNLV
jgi:hypothetical protein